MPRAAGNSLRPKWAVTASPANGSFASNSRHPAPRPSRRKQRRSICRREPLGLRGGDGGDVIDGRVVCEIADADVAAFPGVLTSMITYKWFGCGGIAG